MVLLEKLLISVRYVSYTGNKNCLHQQPKIWLRNLSYENSSLCQRFMWRRTLIVGAAFCRLLGAIWCWCHLASRSTLGVSFLWLLFVCLSMFNAVCLCHWSANLCHMWIWHICFTDIEQLIFIHFNPKTRLTYYLVPKVALHLTNNWPVFA